MLDFEALTFQLLTRSVPDVPTKPEHDVGELGELPFCMFTTTGGNQLDGVVGRPIAWEVQLSLSVFHNSLDEARALAGLYYDAVWSWEDPWSLAGLISGLGHATEIEDVSLFSRVGTVDIGDSRSVTQYDGRWALQLHSA